MYIHMLGKRTNILFDKDVWKLLLRLAKSADTSVGDLVRSAVNDTYLPRFKKEKIAMAISDIKSVRKTVERTDYKKLINYGRKY